MPISKKICCCLCCLFLAGCSISQGQYSFISTKPIHLQELIAKNTPTIWSQALSRQHVIALIPLSEAPTAEAAINLLLNEYKGDYLSNVNIRLTGIQILPLYHYRSWRISGTIMRVSSTAQ